MTEPRQHLLPVSPLRVLSLFSGIGGLDLGLERAGMTVIAHSEVDPYASRVLAKHWPNVPNLGDITAIDWADCPPVDVICGGFPCQDISLAGKGAGIKEGTRSGLWNYYADAIRELRPRYVIVENVAALIARGLDIVLSDLAALGYGAWWDCVPAAGVGAPHRRDRVFIVATRGDVAPFDTDTSPMQWASQLGSEPHGDTASVGRTPRTGADSERIGGERRRAAGNVAGTAGAGQSEGDQRQRDGDAPVDLRSVGAHGDSEHDSEPDQRPAASQRDDALRFYEAVADPHDAGREEQRGGGRNT